jgi:UDP-glucose 4-epimerase
MNYLILGGAGFIGQHLAETLFKKDLRQTGVTVIDNLKTSNADGLERFKEYKNLFRFVEADLTTMDDEEFLKIARKHDRIFMLAGSVGVEHVDKDPSGTLFNNLALANKMIPLFQKLRNRHVTFASTSEIYGEGPFSEESNASIGPSSKLRWGYASAKLTTEFMIRASSFPYTIVRFFNVVGPGQLGDFGMVLPRMVYAAKNNKDIVVYGDGNQVRSFCHVHDAVDALIKLSDTNGELFNIGNDEPITIKGLAEKVIELSGSSSKIQLVPYEQVFSKHHGDIYKRVPDLTKIRNTINYSPTYNLNDIITDMLKDS